MTKVAHGSAGAGALGRTAALLREHWLFAGFFVLGLILRAGVAVAYRPALMFSDSWAYLTLSYGGGVVGVTWDRPSGYPLLIHVLAPTKSLLTITTLQHAAGLAVGLLVYLVLLRFGVRRWVAALTSALVLLDGYAIALEQHLLPEAFFTLMVMLAFFLSTGRWQGFLPLAAAGLLLGAAVSVRTIGLFIVPVWVVYVLWSRRDLKLTGAGAVAAVLPILALAALPTNYGGPFGLSGADGWFLYGRIGEISDCKGVDVPEGAEGLCDRRPGDSKKGATYHIFNEASPAQRHLDGMGPNWDEQQRKNALLKDFALAVIRERPGRYAAMVTDDFTRYFRPTVKSKGKSDRALALPDKPRTAYVNEETRDKYIPDFEPEVRAPSGLLRAYRGVFHTPRWLIAALTLAALAALLAPLARMGPAHRPEVFLFTGAGLAMLASSAITLEFELRYLIPAVPLLSCGGVLAVGELLAARRERVA